MATERLAIWRTSAIMNFRNLEFMPCHLYRHDILLSCARFYWNRGIGCWVTYDHKQFFSMAAVRYLQFKKNNICLRDCHQVPNL